MKMEWTTLGAQPVVLFLLPPNFATEIKLTLSVMDMAQVTQNNKSSTRSLSSKGRYTIEMECLCSSLQESTDVRQGFNRLKGDLVALPLWTDSVVTTSVSTTGATTAIFDTDTTPSRWGTSWVFVNLTTFAFEFRTVSTLSGSTITFSTGNVLTWPVGSILVPLILGRFKADSPPTFTKFTESVNTLKITFEENSPLIYAINPAPSTLGTVQTNLGLAAAARLWNIPCTYSGAEADNAVVDIDYERIGFGRQDAAFVYPQAPRRVTELAFDLCDRPTIASIESYFLDRQGRSLNLWVPTFRNDADLIENLPDASPTHIQIDPASRYLDTNFTAHPGYPYLCINDTTGQAIFPFKVASIAGSVLTAIVPVTQTFAQNSKISALLLSRFQESSITWTYHTDGFASTTIKWVEAPEDYQNAPYQQFLSQCYLFTNTNAGGTTTFKFTSFESVLVVPVLGTFLPGLFSHGSLKTGLDMSSDEAEIISFQFVGNPLSLLMPWNLVGDLRVDIYDFDRIALLSNLLFSGTIEELDIEGAKITAKAQGFGGLYDQQFHRHVMAGDCPYAVYTPECGAPKTAVTTQTRTIISVSGANVVISAIPGGLANAFKNGIFEVISGGTYQIIQIVSNSGTSVSLSRPLTGSVIGATIQMSIGCDGTMDTCIGFSNQINFGGEINIPPTNPSVAAVKAKDSNVAKK